MYRSDLIRAAVAARNLNKSSFAKESGLGLNTARKLWDGETNIELNSLETASEFLKIPMQKLFEKDPQLETV